MSGGPSVQRQLLEQEPQPPPTNDRKEEVDAGGAPKGTPAASDGDGGAPAGEGNEHARLDQISEQAADTQEEDGGHEGEAGERPPGLSINQGKKHLRDKGGKPDGRRRHLRAGSSWNGRTRRRPHDDGGA
jgi:hypothetical protein